MRENSGYLTEENYLRGKKKIKGVSLIILMIGLLLGGGLITLGIMNQKKINEKYSDQNKNNIQKKLEVEKLNLETKKSEIEAKREAALLEEKQKLESKKSELIAKGVKYSYKTTYDDKESYDLKIITEALDPSKSECLWNEYKDNTLTANYCKIVNKEDDDSKLLGVISGALKDDYCYNKYKNNSYTARYCELKSELKEITDFNKDFDLSKSIPFFMIGAFVIIASLMVSGSIFMMTKQRELLAFHVEQAMPVAQEGLEKMGSSFGKAGARAMEELRRNNK